LHAGTPALPVTYPVIKKMEVQRYQMFFGHFKVECRVTSVAWADATPSKNFGFYFSKLLL
jgi:hypothetical protein